MKKVTREMLKIYVPYSNMDWLNYKLVKNALTFHHIQKREKGGKAIIENGALLMPVGHQYLHLIECKDIEIYITINKIFEIVNNQRSEPTTEQRKIIEYLLRAFEEKHKWDKGSNGKLLIKGKYKDRAL